MNRMLPRLAFLFAATLTSAGTAQAVPGPVDEWAYAATAPVATAAVRPAVLRAIADEQPAVETPAVQVAGGVIVRRRR